MSGTTNGEVTTNTDPFKAARDAYIQLRWDQSTKIRKAFLAADFLP